MRDQANLNCAPNKCEMGRCCAQFQSVRQQFHRTEALSFYDIVLFALFPLCLRDILSLFYCAISSLPPRSGAVCPIGNLVSGESQTADTGCLADCCSLAEDLQRHIWGGGQCGE